MARPKLMPVVVVLLLAGCGGPPPPAARPLDDLAAKPAEVQGKIDAAEAEHADALKRAESAATDAPADAESH